MIGKPAPALAADPGEAEPVVPLPLAIAERSPALAALWFPGHPEFGGVDPLAIGIEVAHAAMKTGQTVAGRVTQEQLVPGQAPGVRVEGRYFGQEIKLVRAGQVQFQHLAFGHVELDRGGRKSHVTFEHGELAEIDAGFEAHAAAAPNRDLRRRYGED